MSETTTCGACGTVQAAGSAFCATCGTAFPRTGRPYTGAPPQEAAPYREHGIAVTTEREIAAMTQRSSGPVPAGFGSSAPSPTLEAPVAGVGRRFVAFLVDGTAIGLVVGGVLLAGLAASGISMTGLTEVASPTQAQDLMGKVLLVYVLAGVVSLACWVAVWVWEGRTGRTLGNLATGLRTVRAEDRSPVGFGRAALRWIITGLGALAFGMGELVVVLSPAFDSSGRNQGWQDKAAKALVLDVRATGKQAHGQGFSAPAGATAAGAAAAFAAPSAASAPGAPWSAAPAPVATFAPPQAAAPATAQVPVEDPWAFPAPAQQGGGHASGLITGIPGTAKAAPAGTASPAAPVTGHRATPAVGPVAGPETGRPTVPVAPAPVRPSPVVPPVALAADEDPEWDSTRLSVSDLRREPVPPPAGFVLELPDGRRVPVTGRALVGRNPQPTGVTGEVLVSIEDPTRSVSKTHAEMLVEQGTLWLTDRGSTNGTILTGPGTAPQILEPGVRVVVPVGSSVQVGDQSLTVRAGSAS